MGITDSDEHMRIQIEQAAAGTVADSPHLFHALRHYGVRASRNWDAIKLRIEAIRVCKKQGWTI